MTKQLPIHGGVELVDDRERDALREHFDTTDLVDAVDSATWETTVDSDPMIVTSVRLPKSLLDWVREQAAAEQLKPTALIRRWIEDRRRTSTGQRNGADEASVARLADRVSRLEAIALRVVSSEPDADGDGMAELLAALQASVDAVRTKGVLHREDQERRGA
jgi:hypothetical protein